MIETTIGREPVQVVEILQPICVNTFGTAPCTATGAGPVKCYNTRATCKDPDNYRVVPEASLGAATQSYNQGDTVDNADFTKTAPLFMVFDVEFPASPLGLIWELGGNTTGAYFGVTGTDLVLRAGDGSASDSDTTAKIATPVSAYAGAKVTFFIEIVGSTGFARLWSYDKLTKVVTLVGSDTAVSGFPSSEWAGTGDGGVGTIDGGIPTGEEASDFNGTITRALMYDNTAAPDMTVSFTNLSLFFASGKVAERGITGADYVIPSLVRVSTSPTRINLSGANPDATGLGNRALCSITFADHPHTDRIVDPYLSGRDWDPLARGSFWTRWLVRNKYRQNVQIRVYEGYADQALSAMTKRTYFLQSVDGPDDGGTVTIQGKDILARIEERKAQAPVQSPGVLYAGIGAGATSLTIANAVLADYPSSGTLRINNELMTYTATATGANGVNVSGLTRGTDGTTAASHATDDAVQECLRYTAAALDTVLEDLLRVYGGIDASYLNTTAWATEVSANLLAYTLNAVISVPTSVTELVSEIQQQVPSNIWWDERTATVELKALRGVDSLPDLITAEKNIVAGSFSLSEKPRERASQVWIYYNLRNKAENEKDPKNYKNATIVANLESETDELYGEPSVRKIFARWLNTSALAETTASKISTVYVDIPTQCRFRLDAKDRGYWIGDTLRISHHLDVDEFGDRRVRRWTIVSAEEVIPGETVEYLAEDTTLYGLINYIMVAGAADYVVGGPNPARNCFIGDASGLLSDSTACGTIS